MTARFPTLLTLAALLGFAGPALAAETHAARHDPQVAASTTKGHATKAASAKENAPKGRHAKAPRSKRGTAKTPAAKTPAPATPAPAAK